MNAGEYDEPAAGTWRPAPDGAGDRAPDDAWPGRPPEGVASAPPTGDQEEARERAAHQLQQQLSSAEQIVESILQSRRQRDVASRMTFGPERHPPPSIDQAL